MNSVDINKRLQKEIYLLLLDQSLWGEKTVDLQNDFIDKYYLVLKTCADVSITKEALEKLAEDERESNYIGNMKFLSNLIENERTYVILNYFLSNYIQAALQAHKYSYLDSGLINYINSEYNRVIKSD